MSKHPIPDAALDDRLGFVGMTGSGKTFGAGTCVERILARKGRVIIPDPLGVWWGLRLDADGKTASPYDVVIFGGPHGDLAVTPHAGALIGETVANMRESAIVDLSQFDTAAAERRFMLAFLDAIYRKTAGEPVHLIFDEADLWAPEKILDKEGEATKLHGMMQSTVRRGRVKGLTSWLISQRPASLSKQVLSQVDGLIAFRLTASQDRKALGLWIEGQADREAGKAILGRLPEKGQGEAVVWLPARGILEDVTFPLKATFDSSRAPKRGEKWNAVELKPLDLGALRDQLATVEKEVKANDPKTLRGRIVELEGQLAAKRRPAVERATPDPAPAPDPDRGAIAAAEMRGYDRGRDEGEKRGWALGHAEGVRGGTDEAFRRAAKSIGELRGELLSEAVGKLREVQGWVAGSPAQPASATHSGQRPAVTPSPSSSRRAIARQEEEPSPARGEGMVPSEATADQERRSVNQIPGNVAPGQPASRERRSESAAPSNESEKTYAGVAGEGSSRLLAVLVRSHPQPLTPDLWAAFAETSAGSGWWNARLKELREAGFIKAVGSGFVGATEAGIAASHATAVNPGSMIELWALWRDRIAVIVGPAAMTLLGVLVEHRAHRLTAEQWGLLAGKQPGSGWWNAAVKQLREWELIDTSDGLFLAVGKGAALLPNAPDRSAETGRLITAARIGKLSPAAARLRTAMEAGDKRSDIAARAGLQMRSGYWNAAIKELLASGLVAEEGGVLRHLTEDLA